MEVILHILICVCHFWQLAYSSNNPFIILQRLHTWREQMESNSFFFLKSIGGWKPGGTIIFFSETVLLNQRKDFYNSYVQLQVKHDDEVSQCAALVLSCLCAHIWELFDGGVFQLWCLHNMLMCSLFMLWKLSAPRAHFLPTYQSLSF